MQKCIMGISLSFTVLQPFLTCQSFLTCQIHGHVPLNHVWSMLQYVLPTDSPHLSKNALRLAISPMLWAQCKPDRFDSWSAGVYFN